MATKLTVLILLTTLAFCQGGTFHNPLFNHDSADPYMIRHGDYYYLTFTEWDRLTVRRSREMTNWSQEEARTIYTLPPGYLELWAPEIHFIRGNFYIYFTMKSDANHASHRMYVIKALDPNNPLGEWTQPLRLVVPGEDYFAIDGTVLETANGNLYHIWSGWSALELPPGGPGDYRQELYIAPMHDPLTISGPRAHLRTAGNTWEWDPDFGHINEGPSILKYGGRTFLVYSGASTWRENYCLGALVIDDTADPMVPSNWRLLKDDCIFYKNVEQGVLSPGHASFVASPDGKESWIIYHAIHDLSQAWTNRTARAEKFLWNYDGTPAFPRPSGFAVALDTPSGQ